MANVTRMWECAFVAYHLNFLFEYLVRRKSDYIYAMKNAFFAFLLSPFMAFSGGYQTNIQSVKALGMGHCGVGCTGDASALFFNPGQANSLQGLQ